MKLKEKLMFLLAIIVIISGFASANSITINKEKTNEENNITSYYETVFSDNFNDNSKDYNKWSELYNAGEWYERNQQCEFELYENDGTTYSEGIESSSFQVSMASTKSVIASADMLTDIYHSDGQYVGQIHMSVTDGTDSITASYYRHHDELSFRDSKGGYTVLNDDQDDGSWIVKIEIRRDKYRVEMNSIVSDWINYKVFTSSANPYLRRKLFIHLSGDQPDNYWIAGFDNVVVDDQGDHPVVDFSYDCHDYTVDFDASSLTYDPDGGETVKHNWDFENDGVDDASGKIVSYTYPYDGTFECELWVKDDDGEEWYCKKYITVPCLDPPPVACYSYEVTRCTAYFDASCSTGDIISYEWTFGDGSTGTGITKTHTYQCSGTYSCTLRVEDSNGYSDTETKSITVQCLPVACYDYDVDGCTVSFDASCSTGDIVVYAWNFDDGSTGSGISPTHTFADSGTYSCYLWVEDPCGDFDTETKSITVNFDPGKPDLVADWLSTTPSYFNGGESVELDGHVVNEGTADVNEDFWAYLLFDERIVSSKQIYGLSIDSSDWIEGTIIWPDDHEYHEIKLVVEILAGEENTENNVKARNLLQKDTSDLRVSKIETDPVVPEFMDEVKIKAHVVSNEYASEKSFNVEIRLYPPGSSTYESYTERVIDGMGSAHWTIWDSGQWSKLGNYKIEVIADCDNEVTEPNENNNVLTEYISTPKSKVTNMPFFDFLQQHPNLLPLLRFLIKI